MIVVAILLTLSINDTQMPSGYTCDDVRRIIAEQGRVKALALAIEQGLSIQQITAIRRACKV